MRGAPEIRPAYRAVLDRGMSRLERRDKRRPGRQWRVHQPRWVDPYPWVLGTFPEKLVFAWLATRGIPFTYQGSFPDYPGTLTVEEFRPDFMLDQLKVVIEVQGEYFHSLPAQAEHDVYKFAIYELSGWKCHWFWESDILTNLDELMSGIDGLMGYVGTGTYTIVNEIDDLQGLRSMNSRSRRVMAPALARR